MRSENLIFINRTNDVFRSKRSATINLFFLDSECIIDITASDWNQI